MMHFQVYTYPYLYKCVCVCMHVCIKNIYKILKNQAVLLGMEGIFQM